MNTTTIHHDEVTECYKALTVRIFQIARHDCEKGNRENALQALRFLCSEQAETWASYLIESSIGITGSLDNMVRFCWAQMNQRFGLTLADLETEDR